MTDQSKQQPIDPETQEAQREKAKAEARKAKIEADNLELPSARRAEEARNLQAVAESEQKAAVARQQQLTSLIPDLSGVKDSVLEVDKAGPGIGSSALTFGGLSDAADEIVKIIDQPRNEEWRILVTSDQDLVTPDAQYLEVEAGLTELVRLAREILRETQLAPDVSLESEDAGEHVPDLSKLGRLSNLMFAAPALGGPVGVGFAAAGAIADALPYVLSLLSAKRSVTSGSVTVTDLAAATAVAGAMERRWQNTIEVVHDEFRLVSRGRTYAKAASLAKERVNLLARKLAFVDQRAAIDEQLSLAKQHLEDAEKAVNDASKGAEPGADLIAERDRARRAVAELTRQYLEAVERLSLIESTVTTLDAFNTAIHTVPTGGRRSPLATATLHEQLRAPDRSHDEEESAAASSATGTTPDNPRRDGPEFTHVLLVKAQPGQWTQLVSDRPLMLKDKYSTLVETNVTFALISTSDSRIVRAGTVSSLVSVYGELGSSIEFRRAIHRSNY